MLNSKEAFDLMVEYDDKLQAGQIKNQDLPPEYYDAVNIVCAEAVAQNPNYDSDGWNDVQDMFLDIKTHVKIHGPNIVQGDSYIYSRIGYRCSVTDKRWYISKPELRNIMSNTDSKYLTLKRAFQTQPGKENIVVYLNTI